MSAIHLAALQSHLLLTEPGGPQGKQRPGEACGVPGEQQEALLWETKDSLKLKDTLA